MMILLRCLRSDYTFYRITCICCCFTITIANAKHVTLIRTLLRTHMVSNCFSVLFEQEDTYSQLQRYLQIHVRLAYKEDVKRKRY